LKASRVETGRFQAMGQLDSQLAPPPPQRLLELVHVHVVVQRAPGVNRRLGAQRAEVGGGTGGEAPGP
jgi:hypothetical protein